MSRCEITWSLCSALALIAGCGTASKPDDSGPEMSGLPGAGGAGGAIAGGVQGSSGSGGAAGIGVVPTAGAAGTAGSSGSSGAGGSAGAGGAGASGASAGGAGAGGVGGAAAGGGGAGAGGASATGSCPGLPPAGDYGAPGPFDTTVENSVGPGGAYTLFRPDTMLGANGLKHPIAVWGNGITTTPSQYTDTLTLIASHGIVLLACNSTNPEQPCLDAGLDWLVEQNASGPMAGKLDTTKEITVGYSWGGGAAIDTATRPNVVATVSFHGMPPRMDPWAEMHAPLLLYTSTGDTFVSASGYVTPNYEKSVVPTFYATLNESVSHTYIIDAGGGAEKERGPAIAFMRYFACDDQEAKALFFGPDCTLCASPFSAQTKPADFWQ